MRRSTRRRSVPLLAAAVVLPVFGLLPPASAQEDTEQIENGHFTDSTDPWWWTPTAPAELTDGRLCAAVDGDTANPWDAIVGHHDIRLETGESYALSFVASASIPTVVGTNVQLAEEPYTKELAERSVLTTEPTEFSYAFTSGADIEAAQLSFEIGGSTEPWTFCLDDVSLRGGEAPPPYEPDTGPRVRVNQVGYLPTGPKHATLVTDAAEALPWQLTSADGTVVAEGQTTPQGIDPSSDQATHGIDFGTVTAAHTGLTLTADGETSHPFDIDADLYDTLRTDALAFFYHQRSGIEIDAEYVGEDYARPAGHLGVAPNLGDLEVPCQPGVCDYTLDVSGGWYDAGDHGKYVVNGGISAAQVMSIYERALTLGDTDAVADGTSAIPEQANGVPDVLDEARWQLEFLLSMQVPQGEEQAGLVHHKIHDDAWTGLPLAPHRDPQTRELHPVSTAATLNLAAAGAQCARLFAEYDVEFAAACRTAAETAWEAAHAHPIHYADPDDGIGGGAYSDNDVTDEFYWAAAELYLATGSAEYLDAVTSSTHHGEHAFTDGGFGWAGTAALGLLNLATVPSDLPAAELAFVRDAVVQGAQRYADTASDEVYGLPYAPADHAYVWGSNSQVLNNMVVLGTAYDLTGEPEFRDAVLTGWDYLLGANPLNVSYVTGYGEYDARNQHHRFWANQLDPSLPNPPAGSVAGGPNVSLDDPVAADALTGCAPAFCYIDDIESWSTNEVTINWNAPLAWAAAFTADVADPAGVPEPSCTVSYLVDSQWDDGFTARVRITNTGAEPLTGWTLSWDFDGDQQVTHAWNTRLVQRSTEITATDIGWNGAIEVGGSESFGFNGSFTGTNASPRVFALNGAACR